MPIKVAYMLGSLNRGGTETLLLDVFRHTHNAPFPFIGIHRHGGAYEPDFMATGCKIIKLTPHKFRFLSYLVSLRRLLREEQITHVHAQQTIDAIYARLATIGTKIKVVETFHGYDYETGRLGRLLNRLSICLSDAVCFVSQTQKDYYISAYALKNSQDKLHMVYNGIDFSKFDVQYDEPDFFKKIDSPQARNNDSAALKKRRIRMVMVGNFVSGRSQSYPCMSIQLLAQRGIADFDLYFIGRRNDKEAWLYDDCVNYCQEHNLQNVHFLGGRADVPAILQHADAFVYSTDHDTFGIAVVEAMATGLPVLVNDWAVMQEVLSVGGYELSSMWQTGNADSLADLIEQFLSDPDKFKQIAQKHVALVRQRYSIETHIDNLHTMYLKI